MTMLTAKEFAAECNTDGRTARKFLRQEFGIVGKGARWEIERKSLRSLKSKFAKWDDLRKVQVATAPEDAADPDELPDEDLAPE